VSDSSPKPLNKSQRNLVLVSTLEVVELINTSSYLSSRVQNLNEAQIEIYRLFPKLLLVKMLVAASKFVI
jgi:hypothetical protein